MNTQNNKCSVFSRVVQWCISRATRTLVIQLIDSFSDSTTSTKVLPNDQVVHIAMHDKLQKFWKKTNQTFKTTKLGKKIPDVHG
jgi:hypothetical protein